MSKHSKLLTVLLTVVLAFSMISFTAYAEGEDAQDNPDPNPGEEPVVTEPYVPEEPDYTEPYVPEEPDYTEPYVPDYTEPYVPDYTEPYVPDYTEPAYSGDNGNQGGWYDSDGNSHENPEDVYVGGGQSYAPPISTAPSAALYETEKKIDVNELNKNDWGDIASRLKNASLTDDGDDGSDFAFIQKNTGKGDNGYWIIIAGALLVTLSFAGFIYLIASSVSRRKKMAAAGVTKSQSKPQARDDYNDGYGSSADKSASKRKNGKRYK